LSTGVQTAVGKFVWHENNSTDIEKAKSFYTELLGWQTEVWTGGGIEYPMIKVGDRTHGGFSATQEGVPSHWMGSVLVTDVDETVLRAEGAGGKILAGPMDIPEIGRFAVIADPQGATLAAYSSAGEPPQGEGTFVWDELQTSDVDAAKRFYGEVFGWTSREMSMGDGPRYTIFQRAGEVDAAGATTLPEDMQAPPHWLTYIATDDVDATVARAKELGANVWAEPFNVPTVGRMAIIQDPVGAAVALFKPSQP
jgi:predicted enzyme related to lactoylglutathione lyase